MSVQREPNFAVLMRNLPGGLPAPDRFDLVSGGMAIGSEVLRVNPQGVLVVRHKLRVEATGDARIDFRSYFAAPQGETPQPVRSITVKFGHDYPGLDVTKPNKLRKGEYRVSLSDIKPGDQLDSGVKHNLKIMTVMHDVYTDTAQQVYVDRGLGQYPAYELIPTRSYPEEVIYDSQETVITNIGGERVEVRGFSPLPVNSEMIKATLDAASKFALLVREAIEGSDSSLDLSEITTFKGPYGRDSLNLLDVFTVRVVN